jgi:arylsulfatase
MKSKKLYIFSVHFFIALTFWQCTPTSNTSNQSAPNIIYILADDLGYGELGCYGQKKIETPHIDVLAKGGMMFTNHYSGAPVCAPARCILLTGKHAGHSFVRGNHEWGTRGNVWDFNEMYRDSSLEGQYPIPDSLYTIGEFLQENNYVTGLVGKWGLGAPGTEGTPNSQGFDFFYGYNCQRQAHTLFPTHLWKNHERHFLDNELVIPHKEYPAGLDPNDSNSYAPYHQNDYAPTAMQDEALAFIKRQKDNQPFFLYYATPIPHVPLQAPKRWVKHYREKFGEEEPYTGKSYFPNQYPRATYAAMISYLDEQVGELIQTLKDYGRYENTLIIFTSDNGPTYAGGADTPFFDSAAPFETVREKIKGQLNEGGIRVPMIAHWHGHIKEGSKSDHISSFYDVFATVADLIDKPTPLTDGISFMPTLLNKEQKSHDHLYWEFPSYGGQQAVRKGKWKGIRKNILEESNTEIALYNLDNDPQEKIDVSADYPEIVKEIALIMNDEHDTSPIERFRMAAIGD